MPLLSCRLCGKVFSSAGGRTCTMCLAQLDNLYPRVREYLRDNPKIGFNIETLSEEMNEDVRYIQALVDMGYLDRDAGKYVSEEALNRQKLAKELEGSLKQMRDSAINVHDPKTVSYGQQRYGEKLKKMLG